jgi:hypothetical protein
MDGSCDLPENFDESVHQEINNPVNFLLKGL